MDAISNVEQNRTIAEATKSFFVIFCVKLLISLVSSHVISGIMDSEPTIIAKLTQTR